MDTEKKRRLSKVKPMNECVNVEEMFLVDVKEDVHISAFVTCLIMAKADRPLAQDFTMTIHIKRLKVRPRKGDLQFYSPNRCVLNYLL